HPDGGVVVGPLKQADPPLYRDIRVLKRLVFWQFLGQHLSELPHPLMAPERAAVDQDDDVLGDIALEVPLEGPIERSLPPGVDQVQVVIKHFTRSATTQILHTRPPV